MKKTIAAIVILLAAALFLPMPFSLNARAAGDLTVSGGTEGTDYVYSGGVLTVKTNKALTISGTTSADRIVVDSPNGANITLSDVSVTFGTSVPHAAFEIVESSGDVKITQCSYVGRNQCGLAEKRHIMQA